MARTIVCAIDDRMSAETVMTAGELAETLDARVVLVHVQPDPPLLPGTVADRERARHRVIRTGTTVLSSAGEMLPAQLDVAYRAEFGPVSETVRQVAEDEDASLLVVGCRRRGALASSVLGSVSNRLARESPCTLVIVPSRTRHRIEGPRQGLVVGIDGSAQAVSAAAFADALSDRLGDHVLLVHGDWAPRGSGSLDADGVSTTAVPDVMKEALACTRPGAGWSLAHGRATNVLRDAAIQEHARFIVIGAPDGAGSRPSRMGSVAAELPRQAPCPVIVVRGFGGVQPTRDDLAAAEVAA
jgi:nucleotide-binding universal stress UspA family protein